jgi:hypothetical protein
MFKAASENIDVSRPLDQVRDHFANFLRSLPSYERGEKYEVRMPRTDVFIEEGTKIAGHRIAMHYKLSALGDDSTRITVSLAISQSLAFGNPRQRNELVRGFADTVINAEWVDDLTKYIDSLEKRETEVSVDV